HEHCQHIVFTKVRGGFDQDGQRGIGQSVHADKCSTRSGMLWLAWDSAALRTCPVGVVSELSVFRDCPGDAAGEFAQVGGGERHLVDEVVGGEARVGISAAGPEASKVLGAAAAQELVEFSELEPVALPMRTSP